MVNSSLNVLERGQVIPDFTLPDVAGEMVSSRSYYMRRNYIIALLPEQRPSEWEDWLGDLSREATSLDDRDVITLVVLPETWRDSAKGKTSDNKQIRWLMDSDGDARRRFGHGPEAGALIITDRYGTVFHSASGTEPTGAAFDPEEIPDWIELIVCRCS
jgi:peroxiredoxin